MNTASCAARFELKLSWHNPGLRKSAKGRAIRPSVESSLGGKVGHSSIDYLPKKLGVDFETSRSKLSRSIPTSHVGDTIGGTVRPRCESLVLLSPYCASSDSPVFVCATNFATLLRMVTATTKTRTTRIRFDAAYPAMTLIRSRYWKPQMVYILWADRPIRYEKGTSRIVYIGETKRGTRRPAGSAASKAMKTFGIVRGIRKIDVHPLTFQGKQNVKMWEMLERDLLSTFKDVFGEIPFYNQQGGGQKFSVDKIRYFRKSRLKKVVTLLS